MKTAVEERWITFPRDGEDVRGYLAMPVSPGIYGAIVTAPENLGVTDHRQEETCRLAAEGFIVLTVDPYSRIGGKPPQDYQNAEERRSKAFIAARDEVVVPDCQAALEWLRTEFGVKAVGALGYCLGGGTALAWSATSNDLACGVILYALPTIPGRYMIDGRDKSRLELASDVKCPLQLHFGAQDEAIPTEQAIALKEALQSQSSQTTDFYLYPTARHAYMDSTLDRYCAEAAVETWDRFVAFFHAHLDGIAA